MSEKFSLKWNDYQSNWKQSLAELRTDRDLADVTLISEDKVKFSAHKVILTSCSNMFKFILKGSSNANPLLFLAGVSSVNLGFILDYIYYGEVNLSQEQLDSFLETAQKLEVEGLLGINDDHSLKIKDESTLDVKIDSFFYDLAEDTTRRQQSRAPKYTTDKSVTKFDVSCMTSEEVEKKKEELFEKRDRILKCLACEYECTADKAQMKRHVETHFEGLFYSCTLCSKGFRSKHSLSNHKSIYHK